ncbi:amidohydrolase family protein [Natrarchaeobius oligotrophus]|uniref:Amidohydrolase n=1 Tax=Natrarchaeobius chitinivorans TaxID=1679083 RepID=A0A3N6MEG2_NATCH|nr:amidohydrolase family protein [Natrarchaeobius chitinivorans]RQH02364.1 amidohydrolase [Natrarchaeobius chitinivorans]
MVQRIDAFAHITPPEFYEEMSEVHSTPALHNLYFEPIWNVDRRLEDMDDHGIDKQVLSLANPPIWRGIDPEDALPLTRLANDLVREIADEHPDRFVPTATIPFTTDAYVEELERCLGDLDMRGVQIFSNVDGRPVDSPGHMALYETAANAGAPVWLHPQLHEWYDWLSEYEVHRTIGWPFDTTAAMMRMVFGGAFEENPDLDVIVHHLGGMVPFFIGRITTFFEARVNNPDMYPEFEAPEFSTTVREQFQNFYGDTVIGGELAPFECGRSFFGDDGVVFATDYPFGPEGGRRFMKQAVDVVETVEDEDAHEAISSANIRALL